MRVADYIIQTLFNEGSKHIFMVTGRGTLFLNDAVAAHKEIKSICLHHEQSAAYAAVAYSQYTSQPAACLVSTGCAGTNSLTGVLNAYQDGNPCIFISGQNKLEETSRYTGIPVRTYGQQEADIISIVQSITKYAVMITDPNQIVYEMGKALHLAKSGRKGPVWIDIPLDVQNMRIDPNKLEEFKIENEKTYLPSIDDISYLRQLFNDAKRPVILIGNGIKSSNATAEVKSFAEKYKIPVTYSASAVDIYGLDKELSIGCVGIMGCSRAANFAIQNSDLVIVLGNRLSSMTTGESCKFAREANIIVVDVDRVEHSKNNAQIDRLIVADIKEFLTSLSNVELKETNHEWRSKCLHWKNIFPKCEDEYKKSKKVDLYYLAECLSDVLPNESSVLTDSGLIELILPPNMTFKDGQRSIHPASQGSMGFALPGLIGAHFASEKPVVGVIGDGSIMMNLQELDTIRYQNIPAKIFVINNNLYAVIRKRQVELFRSRTIGTDSSNGLGSPEFKKVANCFDMKYVKISDSKNLKQKLQSVIDLEGPVLCEIIGLDDQNYIQNGHARNSNNKIVARPLEDQSPYLDRDLLLSEIVIDPIEQ